MEPVLSTRIDPPFSLCHSFLSGQVCGTTLLPSIESFSAASCAVVLNAKADLWLQLCVRGGFKRASLCGAIRCKHAQLHAIFKSSCAQLCIDFFVLTRKPLKCRLRQMMVFGTTLLDKPHTGGPHRWSKDNQAGPKEAIYCDHTRLCCNLHQLHHSNPLKKMCTKTIHRRTLHRSSFHDCLGTPCHTPQRGHLGGVPFRPLHLFVL